MKRHFITKFFQVRFSQTDKEAQIREQMPGPDLHVFTLKFLALKKTSFPSIKNTFQNFFDFCLPLFYATFQCGLRDIHIECSKQFK